MDDSDTPLRGESALTRGARTSLRDGILVQSKTAPILALGICDEETIVGQANAKCTRWATQPSRGGSLTGGTGLRKLSTTMKPGRSSFTHLLQTALAVASSLSPLGCTLIADADRQQCVVDMDCLQRGDAFKATICQESYCVADPAWACMTQQEESGEPGPFTIRLPVVSVLDQAPVPGVAAAMFRKIDVASTTPVGAQAVSDANGIVELTVEKGFDGYVSLSHPTIGPSLYFFNPPVQRSETLPPIRLASIQVVTALFQQVGRTYDPNQGVVILTAEDCESRPLAEVSFAVPKWSDETGVFYSVGGLPTTSTSATDSSGYGGLLGLPPETVAISATHATQGSIGSLSLFVKAGALSYSRMVPSVQR